MAGELGPSLFFTSALPAGQVVIFTTMAAALACPGPQSVFYDRVLWSSLHAVHTHFGFGSQAHSIVTSQQKLHDAKRPFCMERGALFDTQG